MIRTRFTRLIVARILFFAATLVPCAAVVAQGTVQSYFGMNHTAIGQAQLNPDSNGNLVISNIGSSGCDGVEINVGTYSNHIMAMELAAVPGGPFTLSFESRGQFGPATGVTIGRVDVSASYTDLTMTGDFSNVGASSFELKVFSGGAETLCVVLGNSTPISVSPIGNGPRPTLKSLAAGPCTLLPHLPILPTGDILRVALAPLSQVEVSTGAGSAFGDAVEMRAVAQTVMPDHVESVRMMAAPNSGAVSITISEETLGFVDAPMLALGGALIEAVPGPGVQIMNIGSMGLDGVCTKMPPVRSFNLEVAPINPAMTPPGSTLRLEARGSLGGVLDQSLGELELVVTPGAEIAYTADFTSIGSPVQQIQVLSGGMIVLNQAGSMSSVIRSGIWPNKLGKLGGALECFVACTPSSTSFTVDGSVVVGDEIRILASSGTGIDFKSGFELVGGNGLTELEIVGIDMIPAVEAFPGTADDLRLRTAVGGGALSGGEGLDVKKIDAFELLTVHFDSPQGTYDLQPPLVLGSVFVTGSPPAPLFPGLHLALATVFIMVDGRVPTPLGFSEIIAPLGNTHLYVMPAGISGISFLIQPLVLTGNSNNFIFAGASAHEIRL